MKIVRGKAIFAELESIRGDGTLTPEAVLSWARKHEDSELHGMFTWDDSEAAEKWRLEEARKLVVSVECIFPNLKARERVYVSISTDRVHGQGYRILSEVMTDEVRKATLLADALEELKSVRRRYTQLTELAAVWSSIDAVTSPNRKRRKK